MITHLLLEKKIIDGPIKNKNFHDVHQQQRMYLYLFLIYFTKIYVSIWYFLSDARIVLSLRNIQPGR